VIAPVPRYRPHGRKRRLVPTPEVRSGWRPNLGLFASGRSACDSKQTLTTSAAWHSDIPICYDWLR
jgi:hypothetical protein